MQQRNSNSQQQNNLPSEQNKGVEKPEDANVALAHEQAEVDMVEDADLNNEPDPAADLDEGEIARLDNNNDENPLI